MKKILIVCLGILSSTTAMAQAPAIVASVDTPSFITAVLVGLVIAVGFQFLLTMLSVAVGVSSIGNIKENYASGKHVVSLENEDNDHEDESSNNSGKKIISGIGIWNLFTTTIALFGATAIALVLSPIDVFMVKVALALCIWASFYLLVLILEYKLASGLVGGLVKTAMAGIKSSGEAISSMFQSSNEVKMQNAIDHTIKKVRDEFDVNLNLDQVNSTLDKHLRDIKNSTPSYDRIRKDLAAMVKDGNGQPSPVKWTAIQGMINKVIDAKFSDGSVKTKTKINQLKSVVSEMKKAVSSENSLSENVESILKASPVDNKKVDQLMEKVGQILNQSTTSTDSAGMQKKLQSLLNDSNYSWSEIQQTTKSLDREGVKKLLVKHIQMEEDKVDQYVDKAFSTFTTVTEQLGITNNDEATPNLLQSLESRVENYINTTDDPALNYDLIRSDMYKIWNNPNDSLSVIKKRLSTFSDDTIVSLLSNNKYIDRADIDQVKAQVLNAKQDVLSQVDKIETTAKQKLKMLERKAVIQAENTRKIAATAAWWLVATILISGAAAVGGGILTI